MSEDINVEADVFEEENPILHFQISPLKNIVA